MRILVTLAALGALAACAHSAPTPETACRSGWIDDGSGRSVLLRNDDPRTQAAVRELTAPALCLHAHPSGDVTAISLEGRILMATLLRPTGDGYTVFRRAPLTDYDEKLAPEAR